jgi:hypothetical protein
MFGLAAPEPLARVGLWRCVLCAVTALIGAGGWAIV